MAQNTGQKTRFRKVKDNLAKLYTSKNRKIDRKISFPGVSKCIKV